MDVSHSSKRKYVSWPMRCDESLWLKVEGEEGRCLNTGRVAFVFIETAQLQIPLGAVLLLDSLPAPEIDPRSQWKMKISNDNSILRPPNSKLQTRHGIGVLSFESGAGTGWHCLRSMLGQLTSFAFATWSPPILHLYKCSDTGRYIDSIAAVLIQVDRLLMTMDMASVLSDSWSSTSA